MTEDEAKALVFEAGGKAGLERVTRFLALVVEENERQNLVAPSTVGMIWARHAADSVQLARYAPPGALSWLDVGTGGGFPGFAVALVTDFQVTLVEPRRRRAEFLTFCVEQFEMSRRVRVKQCDVVRVCSEHDVISARAVAPVRKLLRDTRHCGKDGTRWILPRGRLTKDDEGVLSETQAVFHVEQSLTDPGSSILLIDRIAQ